MYRRLGFLFVLSAVFVLGRFAPAPGGTADAAETSADLAASEEAQAAPPIVGTYRLMYRELPDGARVDPPQIEGLMTFTSKYRNFNFMQQNAEGGVNTGSTVSRYSMTNTQFSEELVYRVSTTGSESVSFEGAGASGTAEVTIDGEAMTWTMPLNEPVVRFMGDEFTASLEGAFVDYWERVE